jgi:hypothetical protein
VRPALGFALEFCTELTCIPPEHSCRVRDRWRVPRPRVRRPGSGIGNARESTRFVLGSRSCSLAPCVFGLDHVRAGRRLSAPPRAGPPAAGLTGRLAFRIALRIINKNPTSCASFVQFFRSPKQTRPRSTLSIRGHRSKPKWIGIHDPT